MAPSLFIEGGLRTKEWKQETELRRAFQGARNRQTVRLADRKLLQARYGCYLLAVNRHARVRWAQAICQEFSDFFSQREQSPPVRMFFVTLVDTGCSTSVEATHITLDRFKNHFRCGLKGLSYVGMIEPAHYVNVAGGAHTGSPKQLVNWHVHAIVWNVSAKKLRARIDTLGRSGRYRPIANSCRGAHCKRITKGQLAHKLAYMNKSPVESYRVGKSRWVRDDGHPLFWQNNSGIRLGDRIKLFHLLKTLYLDKMAIAGGEGASILRRSKRRALRDLPKVVSLGSAVRRGSLPWRRLHPSQAPNLGRRKAVWRP